MGEDRVTRQTNHYRGSGLESLDGLIIRGRGIDTDDIFKFDRSHSDLLYHAIALMLRRTMVAWADS